MIEELRYLDEEYEITDPIMVEVAASRESDGVIYCLSVVNLHNELIFGIGRTKSLAFQMLRTELKKYYNFLMSSDLDRYKNEGFYLDKQRLKRKIIRRSTSK